MENNLFYSDKEKKYFVLQNVKCECCHKEIETISVLIEDFGREFVISHYCLNCSRKINFIGAQITLKKCFVISSDKLPLDVRPYYSNKPELMNGNISNYDIQAINKTYGVYHKTVDNTKYSFRNGILCIDKKSEIKIGKIDYDELDSFDNKPTNAEKYLDILKNSVPIIPQNKNLIGNGGAQ